MIHISETDSRLPIIRKLFKEILGYNDNEIDYFTKTHFSCAVAINLTIEQVQEICKIFYSNNIQLYLTDQKTNKIVALQKDLGIIIPREPPKSHYCDEPLVSRDHLVDAFTEQGKERQRNIEESRREEREKALTAKSANIPKCPTCGSTNIKHISTLNRAVSIGILGIFSGKIGKNYECLDCKARW